MFDSIQCLLTITAAINGHCSRPPAVTLKDYSGTVQEEEIFFFFFKKKKKKDLYDSFWRIKDFYTCAAVLLLPLM